MDYEFAMMGLPVTRLATCVKCLGGVDYDEYFELHFVCASCAANWDAFPIRTWSDPTQRTEAERATRTDD